MKSTHEILVRRLVGRSNPHDDAPCVSEAYIERKIRREHRLTPQQTEGTRAHPSDPLLREECEHAVSEAGLTGRQFRVLRGRIQGEKLAELAQSRQAAAQTLEAAYMKVRRVWAKSPYAGLAQVYRSETRRGQK